MFDVDFHILNQKATPAIYADTLAARPAAGFVGRLFVATDSPYGVFRDTGSAWVQVASNGTGGPGSTGVNGLNGTTNIGLGGTLINDTTIQGYFDLNIANLKNISLSTINFGGTTGIKLENSRYYSVVNDGITIYETYFFQLNRRFYTTFSGGEFGLNLDDSTGKFAIGDYGNQRKYNAFVVNDDTGEFFINTSYNQVNNNEKDLFYAYNGSAGSRFVKLGDFQAFANNISLVVDDAGYRIYTTGTNATKGFDLDFNNEIYTFGGGDYKIICDALNTAVELSTKNVVFTNINLEDNFKVVPTTKSLLVTLNGTKYAINLYQI